MLSKNAVMHEEIDGWKYYNHALIPTTEPHEVPNISQITDGSVWKISGRAGVPLLARWTTDFDCGYQTEWWYCIKDTPFDIEGLKSKRRYEIKKGKKNFYSGTIDARAYKEELFAVMEVAFSVYPESYRPELDKEKKLMEISSWNRDYVVLGTFSRQDDALCAYSLIRERNGCAEYQVLKSVPDMEKLGVNAAAVSGVIELYNDRLGKEFYLVDGCRNISHQTGFQDYLEKYFGFRKAYCRLNVKYRWWVGMAVKALYPFRAMLKKKDGRMTHQINAILFMESLRKSFGS